jgi:hypothetical protein
MLALMAFVALVLFAAFAGIFVVGMFVKAVIWLVLLPFRVVFGLLFFPLFLLVKIVLAVVGVIAAVLFLPVLILGLIGSAIAAIVGLVVPLVPLLFVAFVVWLIARSGRTAPA